MQRTGEGLEVENRECQQKEQQKKKNNNNNNERNNERKNKGEKNKQTLTDWPRSSEVSCFPFLKPLLHDHQYPFFLSDDCQLNHAGELSYWHSLDLSTTFEDSLPSPVDFY